MILTKKGRVRCLHRYKGLNGNYHPRFRKTRDGYFVTDYQCQIKGCNHWKLNAFKHKLPKKKKK